MNIIIINTGSSSIKFQMLAMPDQKVICSGLVDRIGLGSSNLVYETQNTKVQEVLDIDNHEAGLKKIAELLVDPKIGVIKDTSEITAVGHRVVHGERFSDPMKITEKVKEKIKDLFLLAPLHNPAHLQGINVAEEIFSDAEHIAVFDTAFFQTIPEVAHKYAIPNDIAEKYNIRQYGFHGTSHKFVSERAIEFLGVKESKIITIHLGNGCSITAVKDGKSIDHSMGFSPANGLIMGTRSGDIDHSVVFYLNDLGFSVKEISDLLQKKSGMLGLTGYSDLRDIERLAEEGNKDCLLALAMNAYRIKKFIGSYTAAMGGLDAIVFTAGVGENSPYLRNLVCKNMEFFGLEIDEEKNSLRSKEIRAIHKDNSKTKILVIPTNEELEIAKQVYGLLN
jgi:acetate kinase